MKKVLMLGGLRYLVPVIQTAHELGYYVITCDYLPDNIAHKYSDEYHNVSITDREAVLKLAEELKVDGVMSFAVDPGVLTAAYVSEKLGLPSSPFESIKILQNKVLFRQFLTENNFTVPKAIGYKDPQSALEEIDAFSWPIIVKPSDSAGSKGVARIDNKEDLLPAIKEALRHSLSQEFIIEEFIEKKGWSSDTDCFSVDGDLNYVSFSSQWFDENSPNEYTPAAYTWPSSLSSKHQKELTDELQRLLTLLNMKTSIYNIEVREGIDGKAYIMEVSPRGGGNRLSEMLKYATGADLIKNAIRASVGEPILDITAPIYNGYWAEIILHSNQSGVFQKIEIDNALKANVVEIDLWVEQGDSVNAFKGANDAIGTLVLKFESEKEMIEQIKSSSSWLNIVIA